MDNIIHKAATRGHADHGWLESYQTFSFAGYYNPQRIRFGALRVLNDDRVEGGKGFGSHPHDNMEIISIPLEGSLVHEDNMGNKKVVGPGEVQVMSTGKGIFHSEYNNSLHQPVKFLQIWVFPNRLNVTPRYDQITRDLEKEHNQLQPIVSPAPADAGTWIYQDAWFSMGHFDKDRSVDYTLQKPGNGVYLFVVKGSFQFEGQLLSTRDGLGVAGRTTLHLTAVEDDSELLVMDIPMDVKQY